MYPEGLAQECARQGWFKQLAKPITVPLLDNTCLLCLPADLGLKQWQLADGDAVAAVNCLYELVQQYQHVQEAREVADDELHKAKVRSTSKTSESAWCICGIMHSTRVLMCCGAAARTS